MRRTGTVLPMLAAAMLLSSARMLGQGAPITGTGLLTVSTNASSRGVGATVLVSVAVDLSSVTGKAPGGGSTPAVLGGYQIGISFDRVRLKFVSAAGGSSFGYTSPPAATNASTANASGSLVIVASQTSATSPTGLVRVATLSFTTLRGGVASVSATPTNLVTAFQPGPPGVGPVMVPSAGASVNIVIDDPTATPTPTPTPGPSVTPTPTPSATPTPTPSPTSTPGVTPTPSATATPPPGPAPYGPSPSPSPSPTPAEPYTPVPGQRSVTIPVASHVTGAGGQVFLSDLEVENPGGGFASASLTFTPAGGQPIAIPVVLAPYETRSFRDVVGLMFGVFDGVGALRLDSFSPLRMTSRNYERSSNGSFGQAVTGFTEADALAQVQSVTGLAVTADFRTNLGAVNASGSTKSFRISLWRSDGVLLGSTSVLQLPAGAQMQWSLPALFPQASGKGMTVRFETTDSSSAPFGYATVADNLSGDPTYYPSTQPATTLTLPIASRVTGTNGNRFLSDVSIANVSEDPASVTVRFLEHDRDNTGYERVSTFVLGAHQTRQMDDALGALFGIDETYGSLQFEASVPGALLVSERVYTNSPTISGTVGQQVDPVDSTKFFTSASLLGLQQNTDFRTNLGFFNPQPLTVQATLTLRRDSGSVVATNQISLPPRSYVQRNLAVLFPGTGLETSFSWTVKVESSGGIFSSAVMVDNLSEDPTYSPALK